MKYVNGSVATATSVRPTWIDSISPNATTKLTRFSEISGANVRNICTDLMSEFAREMSWPACTRS